MQQSSSNNSNSRPAIILTIIVILASLGYYFYSEGNISTSANPTSFLSINSSPAVGSDVLALLNQIHSLKIDTTFFKTPVYESLIDFTVAIPSENVGKPNPFIGF